MNQITKTLEFHDVTHGELEHVVKEIKQTINGSMDITVKGVVLPKDISEPKILTPENSNLKGWAGISLDLFNSNDVVGPKISIARQGDDPLENEQKCTIGFPKTRKGVDEMAINSGNLPYKDWEPNDDNTVVVVYVERFCDEECENVVVKTKALMYSYLTEERAKTLLGLNGKSFWCSDNTDLVLAHTFLPEPKVIETVPIFAGAPTAIVHIDVNVDDGEKGIVERVMGWK